MRKPLSQCFSEAADLLEDKGWVQRQWEDEGAHCLIEACREACPGTGDHDFALGLGFVAAPYSGSAINLALNYNDNPRRTAAQVIARLRKYAKIQKRKEVLRDQAVV
jgi:hypothetical protein